MFLKYFYIYIFKEMPSFIKCIQSQEQDKKGQFSSQPCRGGEKRWSGKKTSDNLTNDHDLNQEPRATLVPQMCVRKAIAQTILQDVDDDDADVVVMVITKTMTNTKTGPHWKSCTDQVSEKGQ